MDHLNIQKACTMSSVDSINLVMPQNKRSIRCLRRTCLLQTTTNSTNNFQLIKSNLNTKREFTLKNISMSTIQTKSNQFCLNYRKSKPTILNFHRLHKLIEKTNSQTKKNISLYGSRYIALTFILILQLSSSLFCVNANSQENLELPICTRYQACSAEVGHFPLLSETVGEIIEIKESPPTDVEGSGTFEGSGFNSRGVDLPTEEAHFPLYDEFVSEPTLFDYNADPELTVTQICQCPQEQTNEGETSEKTNVCSFDTSENIMRVDKSLRLSFCQPISQLFKARCAGRRARLRVIGHVDVKTGESLASVNDTAVFCRCDSPMILKRVAIEPWLDKYAFVYRCMRP